ncbi:MAG: hypothetical protein K6A36_00040 [Paludibacteraceae bacterium]|nr:hypothetical protein [Paludibacteraceae bacterium]
MGNRAGSIPALGTPNKRTTFALGLFKKYNKGQAGDLNIRYYSERADCPESHRKGGVTQ